MSESVAAFVEREERVGRQIDAIADAAGALNLANARLVATMADVLTERSWEGPGVHSPTQWLTYRAGITAARAKTVIEVAARRRDFPTIIGRFDAGELSLEQVAELVQAPAWADAKLDDWAVVATPARIRASVKRCFDPDDYEQPDEADPTDVAESAPPNVDRDRVSTGVTDEHRWRISGELDLARGGTVDAALLAAREHLWGGGQTTITLADCLVEVASGYLATDTSDVRRERSKVWIHLDADTSTAATSTAVRLPESVRDRICCDADIQPVWEREGVPFNLGRTQRIVPERLRRAVLLRDAGCRVPGCTHTRFLDIHHIRHWLHGGTTDLENLVALCPHHHRLHHDGRLDITGNANERNGLTFTTADGEQLTACGRPNPPPELPTPPDGYRPPSMERVDWNWVGLNWIAPWKRLRPPAAWRVEVPVGPPTPLARGPHAHLLQGDQQLGRPSWRCGWSHVREPVQRRARPSCSHRQRRGGSTSRLA